MALAEFRILAIDGGGVRGYLAASILANIESYLNRVTETSINLGARFDFIAGTSTGGIIAIGLALGLRAEAIRDLFVEFVPKVFGIKNRRNVVKRLKYPRYGSAELRGVFENVFRNTTLGDLITDACITSVSLADAKPRLHKTDYLNRNAGRLSTLLVDVALSTTAAPSFFTAHSSQHSANLIDGGVAANNPALVAIVDALQFERSSKRGTPRPALQPSEGGPQITMVSVGTGEPGPMPYSYEKLVDGGGLDWLRPIHEVIVLSQSKLVHHQAEFLLKDRYLRVNPILNFPVKLDDAEKFLELRNKADIDSDIEEFLAGHFI